MTTWLFGLSGCTGSVESLKKAGHPLTPPAKLFHHKISTPIFFSLFVVVLPLFKHTAAAIIVPAQSKHSRTCTYCSRFNLLCCQSPRAKLSCCAKWQKLLITCVNTHAYTRGLLTQQNLSGVASWTGTGEPQGD